MPGQSSSEYRLLRAIEAIYEAAPEPSRWPQALSAIAGYFDDVGVRQSELTAMLAKVALR